MLRRWLLPTCKPARSKGAWALWLAGCLVLLALWHSAWPVTVPLVVVSLLIGYTHPLCHYLDYDHLTRTRRHHAH